MLRLIAPISAGDQELMLSYADGVLTDADRQAVPAFADLVVENQVVTSVDQERVKQIRIYPNPVGPFLHLETEALSGPETVVQILDVTGKSVFVKSLEGPAQRSTLTLETGSWEPGLYLIRITSGNDRFHQTVIKR
jgi:hypothetical protein